ncbi:MAG: GerMN domain-containing protein [Thermosynechococcaceae cyanobacterium]
MAKRQRSMLGKLMVTAIAVGLFACTTEAPPQDPQVQSPTPSPTPSAPSTVEPEASPSPSITPTESPAESAQLSVYWLKVAQEKVELAPAKITSQKPTAKPEEQLTAALERLLKGPANADVASSIPEGTKLNTVTVKADGVHLDLNKAFTVGGGSTSMQGRLGQVIYTASSLNPKESVWISIDGEPLTVLGGEGLEVSQPMTRKEFQEEFSL